MRSLPAFINRLTGQQRLRLIEIVIAAASALAALLLIAFISRHSLAGMEIPFIVASMGASSALLFAVPSSPMNHPWAVAGGHLISAVIGVTAAQQIGAIELAAPVAGAGAILMMLLLRCLHPPGGATAMLIVLGGDQVHAAGYQFILTPILLNIAVLLTAALLIRSVTRRLRQRGRRELSLQWLEALEQHRPLAPRLTVADIAAARGQLDTYIDVKDEQLLQIVRLATHNTHQRRLGELRCRDLMLAEPLHAEFGTPLQEVWELFQRHHLHAMPVVDRARHVTGIVTLDDFIRHAARFPAATLEERIAELVRETPGLTSDKPEVAGQIMTAPALTAGEDERVADLLPLLDERRIHHLPVVDGRRKLIGLLSRNEIMEILEREEGMGTGEA